MTSVNRQNDPAALQEEIRTLRADLAASEQARAQAIADLHQSEEHFRLFIQSIKDYAIFILDPTGHIRTWNEGAHRLKGYAEHEILGRHFSTFYTTEDRAQHLPERLLQQAIREGRVESEGWRVRKDGTRFWADVVITAVRDKQGQLIGFVKVTRDLTERQRATEERIHLAEERTARKAAEEAVRQRNEFLGIAAHELKTPITSLLLQVQFLARRLDHGKGLNPVYLRRALALVEDQSRKLSALVNQLLDVSRIANGRLTLDRSETNLVPLVESVVERERTLVPQRTFPVDAPESVRAWVDPLRIEQVLTNLLDNAVKYASEGPIEVTIVQPDSRHVQIRVRDHGPGVPEAKRAHLFERFYQADIHHYHGGMGLGLAISSEIVHLHGGNLSAEFPLDGGSRFVVTLPLQLDNT